MSAQLAENLHQILDRFDDAWNEPPPPRIEDYLTEADSVQRLTLLIELVRIDLERRLAAGEKVRLEETYPRQRFPELYAEPPALVTLVKHEFDLRRRNEPDLSPAECLERFPQFRDDLLVQLATVDTRRDGERQPEMATPAPPASAPTELDLRGYELMETLGAGGMGEVYRCCDPALGRDLAIKVMKEEHRGHPEWERRFLREARITGSLQHPGIVAVHNLGRLKDGRLHYTMRLVRGQKERGGTFADILQDEAGKPERLPYLLSIFEKICQAVAYAHSKCVIHRDLKPHNVMVGKFGEVQVMDWGLAKVLTSDDSAAETEETTDISGTRIHTESADTPVDLSRVGVGFGTWQYMPSEQARGKWNTVDERADVFALGSILCEILTGQPAYSGTNVKELSDRVERGDVTEALQRLQQCGADAALTSLCRECLGSHRDDRPRDADVVAKRVAAYQAEVQERLRQAEVERAQAEVSAREERKRRRLAIRLATVVLTLAVGLTIVAALLSAAWKTEREAKEQLTVKNQQLTEAKEQLTAKNQQLAEAQKQAVDSARETRAIVDDYYVRASRNPLLNHPQFLPLRKSLLEPAAVYYRGLLPKLRGDPLLRQDLAKTCRMVGLITRSIGSYEEALPYMIEYCELSAELARENPTDLSLKAEWARALAQRSHVLKTLKRADEARPLFLQCITIWKQLAESEPAKYAHELAYQYDDMGIFLKNLYQDRNGSWLYLRKGLAIMEPLVRKNPDNEEYVRGIAYFYNNRGELYAEEGNLNASLQDHRRALRIREEMVRYHPQDTKYDHRRWLARSRTRIAEVELKLGKPDQADQHFGDARDLLTSLVERAPANLYYREDLARCCQQYGHLLLDRKQWADAFAALKAAGDNWEKVADAGPRGVDARLDSARARAGAGKALAELGRRKEADVEWQRAVEQLRDAVKSGFKDVGGLKQDGNLKPLHERDDFKKFLAELEMVGKECETERCKRDET